VNRVLADGDAIVVVQLLLLDRLAVDQRPVRASKVDDEELFTTAFDACVVATRRGVAKNQVVVRRPTQSKCAIAGAIGVAGIGT